MGREVGRQGLPIVTAKLSDVVEERKRLCE